MKPEREPAGILYQVDFRADAAVGGDFDTWLRDHVADVLQLPGFLAAEILEETPGVTHRVHRCVQYRLRDQGVLDDFLAGQGGYPAACESQKFGAGFSAAGRALAHREEFVRGAVSTDNCLNCGEVLTGQHCAHCGQPATVRVLSLWGLLKDVLGDALDMDSRLWRTLRPLALRPGWLTQEFLRGRRARYTPPFRMYLILSVTFFLLASMGADPGAGMRLSIDGGESRLQPTGDVATDGASEGDPCDADNFRVELGSYGESYVPRLREACRKIVADSQGYGRALFQNIPQMMFVFLPLIAALMCLLYVGSHRFYVEHLLFLLHFHAFFFLGGLLILLFDRAGSSLGGTLAGDLLLNAGGVGTAAMVFYVPYYLYRAMRRVYGQSHVVTLVKYSLLAIGYLCSLVLTGLGLLVYTALEL